MTICPKCEMEIEEVLLVKKKTRMGTLEDCIIYGRKAGVNIIDIGDEDEENYIECPECGNELNLHIIVKKVKS